MAHLATFDMLQIPIAAGEPAAHMMPKDEDIDRAARVLKAMAHPLRLKILCKLGECEASVQDIVAGVGTTQSNISQHLAIMRDKGVLMSRRAANRVYYRVGDPHLMRLVVVMREVFCPTTP